MNYSVCKVPEHNLLTNPPRDQPASRIGQGAPLLLLIPDSRTNNNFSLSPLLLRLFLFFPSSFLSNFLSPVSPHSSPLAVFLLFFFSNHLPNTTFNMREIVCYSLYFYSLIPPPSSCLPKTRLLGIFPSPLSLENPHPFERARLAN